MQTDIGKYSTRSMNKHYSLDMCPALRATAQSVIWADTNIRLTVKTTIQSVIWADTNIRLILETIAQSVIWADTDIRLIVKTTAKV